MRGRGGTGEGSGGGVCWGRGVLSREQAARSPSHPTAASVSHVERRVRNAVSGALRRLGWPLPGGGGGCGGQHGTRAECRPRRGSARASAGALSTEAPGQRWGRPGRLRGRTRRRGALSGEAGEGLCWRTVVAAGHLQFPELLLVFEPKATLVISFFHSCLREARSTETHSPTKDPVVPMPSTSCLS